MFGFIYVQVIRRKDVSNSPVLLAYQLQRRDDVLAWYETFKLVSKMGHFWGMLVSTFLRHLRWFSHFWIPASASLRCLKDDSRIQVPVLTTLWRVRLVSLT